jgi:cytidine deaminase
LYRAAAELVNSRYPKGWGGAAAMYTSDKRILTSVTPDVINASSELCMETGAILEAFKLNTTITHTLCIARKNEHSAFKVLTPCGICQERLYYWGPKVKAAVTNDQGLLEFKTLEEIQPYHWYQAYRK